MNSVFLRTKPVRYHLHVCCITMTLVLSLAGCMDLLRAPAPKESMEAASPSQPSKSIVLPAEQSAAEQAVKEILKGGETGERELAKSLVEAGFPVMLQQQRFALPNGDNGSGAPIFDWEIAALVKQARSSFVMPLPVLADLLRSIPDLKTVPWETVILTGLRASAESKSAETRYWAFLVDEVGRRRFGSSLLESNVSADQVLLTSLQYQLVLRRLISEILLSEQQRVGQKRNHSEFVKLASLEFSPQTFLAQNDSSFTDRCRKLNAQGIGHGEAIAGKIYEKLIYEGLEKYGVGRAARVGGKLAKFLGAVGGIFDLVDTGVLLASINVHYKLAHGEPLVRTKTMKDGATDQIVLAASYGLITAEYLNCMHLVSATGVTAGATLEAPVVGPIKNADISWEGASGFFEGEWVKFQDNHPGVMVLEREWQIRLAKDDNPTPEKYAKFLNRSGQGYTSVTDSDGISLAAIIGRAQPAELPDDSAELGRRATVLISVNVLKEEWDLGDVVGALWPPSSVTSLVYTATKAGFFSYHTIEFDVRDWAPSYVLKVSSTGRYRRDGGLPPHIVETDGEILLKPRRDSLGHLVYEGKGKRSVSVKPYGKKCGAIIEETSGDETVEVTGTIPSPERAELHLCHRRADLYVTNMSCPCGPNSGCIVTKLNPTSKQITSTHPSGISITAEIPDQGNASTLFLQHWSAESSNPATGFCVDLKNWELPMVPISGKRPIGAFVKNNSGSCPLWGFALANSCDTYFSYDLALPKTNK